VTSNEVTKRAATSAWVFESSLVHLGHKADLGTHGCESRGGSASVAEKSWLAK